MTYGRKPARQRPTDLVSAHMPLVRKIAWHVHGRVSNAVDIEDLVQIGMVALVEAANGYEDRGHAFATYAQMRVRGAMIDHLRRHASQCRSGMAKRKEIARARAEIESRLGRAATESELAETLGLDAAGYREMADAAESVRQESLDEVYSDQSMWFADLEESADQQLDRDRLREALAGAIGKLPEREAMVLQLYFVEELNLEEIGRVLDIGAARVCQIKKAALDKVRALLKGWDED
ncbi:FliA/WhiG family RNA polymerase sigma factor [Sphingomonas morindae]|uniref:FliA/WhiG family RNA polymerase sigma factor n=1 Tax=Sphingomonas morindae TaxID=1541170 RepID=A0ABY4XBZ6_9SPHN|nr:FliA/WhiG family RNA polymerase sigma factor [Sphingomonas morindae]USI74487.1 FliA/WhiG family RNA polymerase sigma factor [Sphingomonas morindae]